MSTQSQTHQNREVQANIILPFAAIDRTLLPIVGGKAANLGEMLQAGLPVPPGFCVTTVAYALVAESADLEPILAELATTRADDTAHLAKLAAAARACLLAAPVPTSIAEAITEAYRALGGGGVVEPIPVAVRSSATAEDLPYASFAGQQDTYLNVVGVDAVIDAVRRCWASLWTDRAVSYRASNGIDQRTVRLAVAVQRMVDATVAGVLFTANPLTGKRRQAVIDASPGLGEAVVSGAVNPDHFVVNTATGEIVERRLGDKRVVIRATKGGGTQRIEQVGRSDEACLSDEQIRALADLGARVEAHYGAPQDTEWAIDASGQIWLTQARPITTLYPLPANAPQTDDVLRVYFSVNVAQGVYRPFTPMGLSAFLPVTSSVAALLGLAPRDPLSGPGVIVEAASRLFIDVTGALRSPFGRKLLIGGAQIAETLSAELFEQLVTDPRLSLVPTRRWPLVRALGLLMVHTHIPLYMLQALLWPRAAVARVARVRAGLQALDEASAEASAVDLLATLEQFFPSKIVRTIGRTGPVLACGLGAYALAGKLLKGLATPDEMQAVLRGLPHNPTMEMDLALWALAQRVQADPVVAQYVRETPPEQQGQDYRAGVLPPILQQELAEFLRAYGHRGVAEIDLGLPRWSEDPTHILGVLANYLQLQDPALAPDVQFRRGAQEAEAMVAELTGRAARKSRLRGMLVGFCLKRVRLLAGMREMPKFCAVFLLARVRERLWSIGKALADSGQLERAEDIFFMTLPETHTALSGKDIREDMRPVVREHRINYERELKRRHVPRVLLSDGTEPTAETSTADSVAGTLRGTPASAGVVTAKARVILDPTGAHLEPGEILVAPSTDPGWTPLFLTAGGLVMEMGGPMSHGAVVAREYGIPAVVAVLGATERISTGQRIRVDGSAGVISMEP